MTEPPLKKQKVSHEAGGPAQHAHHAQHAQHAGSGKCYVCDPLGNRKTDYYLWLQPSSGLTKCFVNQNFKGIQELVVVPRQHIGEFRMMDLKPAGFEFWGEVAPLLLRLLRCGARDLTLEVSYGSWIVHRAGTPHYHAHVHVKFADYAKTMQKVLDTEEVSWADFARVRSVDELKVPSAGATAGGGGAGAAAAAAAAAAGTTWRLRAGSQQPQPQQRKRAPNTQTKPVFDGDIRAVIPEFAAVDFVEYCRSTCRKVPLFVMVSGWFASLVSETTGFVFQIKIGPEQLSGSAAGESKAAGSGDPAASALPPGRHVCEYAIRTDKTNRDKLLDLLKRTPRPIAKMAAEMKEAAAAASAAASDSGSASGSASAAAGSSGAAAGDGGDASAASAVEERKTEAGLSDSAESDEV